MVNAGLRDDVGALDATGADGIGLFRTEFQFLVVGHAAAAARASSGSTEACSTPPATSRSSSAPSTSAATRRCPISTRRPKDESENPAMGWRALRLALDRDGADEGAGPRADRGRGGPRRCASCSRWSPSRGNMTRPARCSRSRSHWLAKAPSSGCPRRIELRRDARSAERSPRCSTCCCRGLDFLSIGTNDLTQFLFAADRSDPRLAERYDWL